LDNNSKLKRVLFVLYYFPPSGGPGVQRCLKFVRYLPQFGWQPIVLTVQADADFQVRDETMLREIPEGLHIKRSFCPEPYGLYRRLTGQTGSRSLDITTQSGGDERLSAKMMRMVRGSFFIPDARMGWIPFGRRDGLRLIQETRCELIFSSGPPFTCHMIGRALHRGSGLPWVADFRDPWTLATFYPKRPQWAKKIDQACERSVVREAAYSLIVGPAMATDLRDLYPDVSQDRIKIVPNGFDPADFEGVPYQRPEKFRITYTGSLFFNRTPMAFFDAMERLCCEAPDFAREVELCFAGRLDDGVLGKLSEPVFKAITQLPGYLPHSESVALLRSSTLLLLLVGTDVQAHSMVTGKVYEYLASGVPILSLGPDGGDAAKLLRETGAGWSFEHNDPDGVAGHLRKLWQQWREAKSRDNDSAAPTVAVPDSMGLTPDDNAIQRFSRREHSKAVAGLFNSLV
jgi:glycosyltransferase involved in cell wall biosynthesis